MITSVPYNQQSYYQVFYAGITNFSTELYANQLDHAQDHVQKMGGVIRYSASFQAAEEYFCGSQEVWRLLLFYRQLFRVLCG